ncbi:ArdC-like ssDNA-binding domain-containing protein [Maridesulfovibrio sp.]|uniref:ArdC-like ssDNA-binding domain-containing protein n=1 Tax=Maridesulfovibrio sp. TaxID=2795000 RepID=UPI0039F0FF38
MAKDKTHYYQSFAEEIIDKLEKGTAPWQRPWKAGEFQPAFNPVSGAVYRGINQIMLSSDGMNDPRFMTYK